MQEKKIIATQEIELHVVNTLKYFHMFRHPLYSEDIHNFIGIEIEIKQLQELLDYMVLKGELYVYSGMYMLEDTPKFSEKRLKGVVMAESVMHKAIKSAAIISSFPFVKSVCISGSLSKGYADERSDIDYFIITQKNRLWICRSLLHLYKKLTFITGKQHSFCMNYFLDESHQELEEKNIFTATEMATLYPVYGYECYANFIKTNELWLSSQFPNRISFLKPGNIVEEQLSLFKKSIGLLLNMLFPAQVNKFLMALTDRWWRYKWTKKNYPMHDYDLAMKTRIYVSKNHPANYQKKVLNNVTVPKTQQVLQVQ
jgi:predicted nucleotidyltransferase